VTSAKEHFKGSPMFYLVTPDELEGLDEWAEWLSALLTGPCRVEEVDGRLALIEGRQLVEVLDRGVRVEVFPDEHAPPHFHVKSSAIDASFTIDGCEKLRGKVTGADLRTIRLWHQHAKPKLIEVWNSTRPGDCEVGVYGRA
jgi:Domain of unknown function (DUF4160)